MIILGIDPGMAETGWGIIKKLKVPHFAEASRGKQSEKLKTGNGLTLVDYGCIKTSIEHNLPQRLLVLKRELDKIIGKYQPDCLAVEQLFFGRNAKTAMIVGLARGVIMVSSAEQNVPVFEYQGLSVKLNLSGDGRCSKSGMQVAVSKILKLKSVPRPQHAADALAVAIFHLIDKKDRKNANSKKKR